MLCFVFSLLIVVLDQLFKRWSVAVLSSGREITLIPKIIGLTYTENTGAAFGIFPNMRWILVGITLICSVVLILILLRYNGGFWSRLGLAAVLGGAVGNLIDRAFRGVVVDMFQFLFIPDTSRLNAIFNVSDVFITLGGITFLVFYLISSVKESRGETLEAPPQEAQKHTAAGKIKQEPDTKPESIQETRPRVLPKITPAPESPQTPRDAGFRPVPPPAQKRMPQNEEPPFARKPAAAPETNNSTDTGEYTDYLKGLSETRILEEFDLDRLLSEYGLDDENN